MPSPKTPTAKDPKEKKDHEDEKLALDSLPSSPGDNPLVVTPKDVEPDKVTARDVTVRPIASPDPEQREEAMLDEAIEETFPASDPIAVPSPYEEELEKQIAAKNKNGGGAAKQKSKD